MRLMEEMKAAAAHLRVATKLAGDWRVRDAVAGAGTAVQCAIYLQQRIAAGELSLQTEIPEDDDSSCS